MSVEERRWSSSSSSTSCFPPISRGVRFSLINAPPILRCALCGCVPVGVCDLKPVAILLQCAMLSPSDLDELTADYDGHCGHHYCNYPVRYLNARAAVRSQNTEPNGWRGVPKVCAAVATCGWFVHVCVLRVRVHRMPQSVARPARLALRPAYVTFPADRRPSSQLIEQRSTTLTTRTSSSFRRVVWHVCVHSCGG